ncbi:MAG TPA: MFS transporter [Candidatus Angelobacter sp.]|nr:MFS transporter [Candidatus Angelobacter sp.]
MSSNQSVAVTSPAIAPERNLAARATAWSLFVLVAVNILNFYDRQVPGALAEPVRKEFGLSDTQLGLIGTMFTVVYALVGLPLGRLADRGSRKKMLSWGIAIWGGLTALGAAARNFSMLLFSRLGVGVGEATCAPAATSWIGDLFPAERRSRPLALFMLGVPVGGALSFFFSGPVAKAYGWRAATVLAAIPALILVPLVMMLKEPARGASEAHNEDAGSIWQVLQIRTFWWIFASGALVNFNLYAIGTFLPAFFSRIHKMNVSEASLTTGIVYGIGGVLGGLVAGFWGDSIVRKRADGRMLSAALAALFAAPLAYFGILQSHGAISTALPLLTVAYGFLNMYYGLVYASIQDLVAPAQRGTTMAVYFLVQYLGGASFGPLLLGTLSDHMAHKAAVAAGSQVITEASRATGLHQAMFVIPVLSLCLAVVLWAGSRTITADVERRRASAA